LTAALAALLLLAAAGRAAAPPAWWAQAQAQARQGGYGLLDAAGLEKLLASGRNLLLLDVRPDYEFAQGHIGRAQNLEFHLGDRLRLDPAKAAELAELAGPDKNRLLVVYCRSYR
jgi:3-mercaptopyruvate sulfurtransferase SseA